MTFGFVTASGPNLDGVGWLGGLEKVVTPIPEPSTVTLIALGGFGLLGYGRRKAAGLR